jgi:hypothetical protein
MFGAIFLFATMALGCQVDQTDFPPPGDYRHSFEISQKYDKFKDFTWLELDLGSIWSDSNNELKLKLFQFFDGEGRNKPSGVPRLEFVNTGNAGWRYLDNHTVTFLVDGGRLKFDPKHDGSVGRNSVLELLWIHPSKDQFLKLLYAKTVEVEVGLDQFELKDTHLNALKDFASYLGTPSRRVSSLEGKKRLRDASLLESKGTDLEARSAYLEIMKLDKGTYEADLAAKGITRLNDPARLTAEMKRMKAKAQRNNDLMEKAARIERSVREKKLKIKIEQNLRLGGLVEKRNPEAAIDYYNEILELAADFSTEPPEVRKARARIKALSAAK